ncbi:uncharacterized protein TNCT_307431 [Trichonephila clavata]|uniref:Uncharacterized protein n=2 Tax=Trichonephila clavata TaxID=2740835 RepID=A0A8X6GWM2_TRICU|nr:uncharacterized protein TNCT_307431 [Trichonephila clavata]
MSNPTFNGNRRGITLPDEFPPRPTSMLRNELHRMNSKIEKKENYTLVLLCLTYFIYGSGIGIYGPLYPQQAILHRVPTYIYGPAMAINFLVALLFYPVACMMVASISCKQSVSTGIFMIGVCKVLFGTLALVAANPFIILSYSIQIIEGIGFSILLASTYVTIFSQISDKAHRNRGIMQLFFILGISLSPIWGEAVYRAFDFSIPFYGIGVLSILNGIFVAAMLPEPDQKILNQEMSIISWTKKRRMYVYFVVIFTTFVYSGFLVVVLDPYLRQFHLNKLFVGCLFAVPYFICGLSAPAWNWLSKKGVNSVLLICIASILIFASLILIGPASFTKLELTLTYVSTSLLLNGLGTGGKLACVSYSATRDLRSRQSVNGSPSPLMIPTMFAFGSMLGYFSGSVIAGFAYFYLGMGKAVYILFGFEIISATVAFIFAFRRNYVNPRNIEEAEEQRPILET